MSIVLTQKAADQLIKVMGEQGLVPERTYLRVTYHPRAHYQQRCSVELKEDDGRNSETDQVLELSGVRVRCDRKSYHYVKGITLDYHDAPGAQGFTITRPPSKWPAEEPCCLPPDRIFLAGPGWPFDGDLHKYHSSHERTHRDTFRVRSWIGLRCRLACGISRFCFRHDLRPCSDYFPRGAGRTDALQPKVLFASDAAGGIRGMACYQRCGRRLVHASMGGINKWDCNTFVSC